MTDLAHLARLHAVLDDLGPLVVACSGGIDSLLLALLAHRHAPGRVLVTHAISPAVQPESTARVREWARNEGWNLQTVQTGEFADENYLSNPVNRCFYCKTSLYSALQAIRGKLVFSGTIVSGANLDDLGEYRPGLEAAADRNVRHPWVEANVSKADIRAIARTLNLSFAELPSSPCLASRLYTGTRVTPARLRAVHDCETLIREATGIRIVRCRIREAIMLIEVHDSDRSAISPELLLRVRTCAQAIEPEIRSVELDQSAYQPGRAFVGAK